ncbi:MAG: fatty acid desaturase [Paracoccaceae bacterium]
MGQVRIEWPTAILIAAVYAAWGAALWWLPTAIAWPVLVLALVLHASLTHEVIHGHPTGIAWFDAALVWPALTLVVPWRRFRDTHLAHHFDARLTDPYDDPESNYLDPATWARLPRAARAALRANNTLAGRIVLGPLIGQAWFMAAEWRAARAGDRTVTRAWAVHLPAALVAAGLVALSPTGWVAYLTALWAALGILRIRTFLEHRAHAVSRARTVVIEDRGLLAFLFLNNNLHAVHHMMPDAPWYRLPALYARNRKRVLAMNEGYVFPSYAAVARAHLWRAKDPVAHPLMPAHRPVGSRRAGPIPAPQPASHAIASSASTGTPSVGATA